MDILEQIHYYTEKANEAHDEAMFIAHNRKNYFDQEVMDLIKEMVLYDKQVKRLKESDDE